MKNTLCAVLLLAPLAGCAVASEPEPTGSTSEALVPSEHTVFSDPKISLAPRGGASVHASGMLPDNPTPPGGPVEGILNVVSAGGLPQPEPTPGGPVER
jgi:hypothetical protein